MSCVDDTFAESSFVYRRLLFPDTACWFSNLEIHRVRCRSSLLALHLHYLRIEKKEGMLKITITNTAKEERWTLQGRLAAPWVKALKTSWTNTHRTAEGRRCIVNLDEVTFIDESGERMLRCMSNQGAQLVASDVYVKHVLDHLKGRSN
jgi:hypothetical protein